MQYVEGDVTTKSFQIKIFILLEILNLMSTRAPGKSVPVPRYVIILVSKWENPVYFYFVSRW